MVIPFWAIAQVEGITYQAVLVDNNPIPTVCMLIFSFSLSCGRQQSG